MTVPRHQLWKSARKPRAALNRRVLRNLKGQSEFSAPRATDARKLLEVPDRGEPPKPADHDSLFTVSPKPKEKKK